MLPDNSELHSHQTQAIPISVVMATYNGALYLDKQIQSILNQTIKPAELIICDDCSTDGTAVILEKYSQEGVLRYVINPIQLGLIGNFKKAVAMAATGNYVSLSDQDDEWLPNKLEICAALLNQIEDKQLPCMVHSDLMLVDERGQVLNQSFRNELGQDAYQHNLQTLIYGNFVNGCTMLMNPVLAKYFAEIPSKIAFNHDGWLALVAFTFGKAAGINEPLVKYLKHSNNFSIAADTKPRNRYRSTIEQFLNAFKGQDAFLLTQFEAVETFYNCYVDKMPHHTKQQFEAFLKLKNRPYIVKKLAFRKLVNKYRL